MSFDLAVISLEQAIDLVEAGNIYAELCDGNYEILGPSAKIDAFYAELIGKYPDIDNYSDDEVDKCPWSVEIDISDGAVVMCMVWSRVDEVAPYVINLAARHDLSCYDPQNEKLYLSPSLSR
jgi:hypothetical protein